MTRISPITNTIRGALYAGCIAVAATTMPSCSSTDEKFDSFEKQAIEMVDSSHIINTENSQGIQLAKMMKESNKGSLKVNKLRNGEIYEENYELGKLFVRITYTWDNYPWVRERRRISDIYISNDGKASREEFYPNGNVKCIRDFNNLVNHKFSENGVLEQVVRSRKTQYGENVVEKITYNPDGKTVKSHWLKESQMFFNGSIITNKEFYEDGSLKTLTVEDTGKGKTVTKEYDKDGTLTCEITEKNEKAIEKTYFPNGYLATEISYEWNPEARRIYDSNGGYKSVGDWFQKDSTSYPENSNYIMNFFHEHF